MCVRWMFVILVGCGLSHATHSQSTCACKDQLKNVCVPVGDNVAVPCPELHEKVTYNLFQDGEMIYNHTCSNGKDAPDCKSPSTRVGVELHENTANKSVSFMLTKVNASSHGIYRCDGMVRYPPPIRTECAMRILVLVEGHQCNIPSKNDETGGSDQNWGFHWIWINAVISIYSVTVTILAIVIWVKLRKTDSQSDYMNTKPKASRDRKKKKWVQNPIPRYF